MLDILSWKSLREVILSKVWVIHNLNDLFQVEAVIHFEDDTEELQRWDQQVIFWIEIWPTFYASTCFLVIIDNMLLLFQCFLLNKISPKMSFIFYINI